MSSKELNMKTKEPIVSHTLLTIIKNSGEPMVHRDVFKSKEVPGVTFNILAVILGTPDSYDIIVHLKKSPSTPTNVTYNVALDSTIIYRSEMVKWSYKLMDEIPISICKRGVNVNPVHSIKFNITWHGFAKLKDNKSNLSPSVNLYRHVKPLFMSSELADFTIIIDDKHIPTHKAILASQSPVFMAMFTTDMRESQTNQVNIHHITFDTMKKVLEFLYTGEIDAKLDVDILLSILSVADEYQIMDLKDLCEAYLCTKITVNNALNALEKAHLCSADKLYNKIISFMVHKKREIVKLDNFQNLFCTNPIIFLKFVTEIGK